MRGLCLGKGLGHPVGWPLGPIDGLGP